MRIKDGRVLGMLSSKRSVSLCLSAWEVWQIPPRSTTVQVGREDKPLVSLLNWSDLNAVRIWYQRLLMRMMRYNPRAQHVPGKTLSTCDKEDNEQLKKLKCTLVKTRVLGKNRMFVLTRPEKRLTKIWWYEKPRNFLFIVGRQSLAISHVISMVCIR